MNRAFTYTKQRLSYILRDILDRDVMSDIAYEANERAEEGFEKRATLEFLLWFLDQAFPDNFTFRCEYEDLEEEYGESVARQITEGPGWVAGRVREQETSDNVVFVDFKTKS
ncbi:MAG: hypothetical protein OEQ13_06485 [Acidobacteriota bacterium]|nr:hypothetical protein [Acidobacteriota bacterium]